MGDPGLPIMAGVLAVPVAVLLLVLVLALMGRRWVVTGPGGTIKPPVKSGVGGIFPASPTTDFDWLKERSSVKN